MYYYWVLKKYIKIQHCGSHHEKESIRMVMTLPKLLKESNNTNVNIPLNIYILFKGFTHY